MLLLCFFLFGDFTYHASSGTWLDVARTGPLSEHRFLVVEQNGAKGEYSLGATQKVLDDQGVFLYDIPVAQDAWTINTGILGDEDTYLFQNRGEKVYRLWHPIYGERVLKVANQLPQQGSDPVFFAIRMKGSRIIMYSEKVENIDDVNSGTVPLSIRAVPRIEIIDFKAKDVPSLFLGQGLLQSSYVDTIFNSPMSVHFDHEQVGLFKRLERSFIYFDFETPIEGTIPFKEKKIGLQIKTLYLHNGFYAIAATDETYQFGTIAGNKPLFTLKGTQTDIPGYNMVFDFFRTFHRGITSLEGSVLSYQEDGTVVAFDTTNNTMRQYRMADGVSGLSNVHDAREVTCDERTLRVRKITPAAQQLKNLNIAPLLEVSLDAFSQ